MGAQFYQNLGATSKFLAWERVTYWGSTNIRCLCTKVCWRGNLVSGICAHVTNMTVDLEVRHPRCVVE